MKNEDSKLLLGLGLGAIAGAAVGYLMSGENRQKLEKDLCKAGDDIKDSAKSVYSKMKCKAEHTGSKFAEKTGEWSEKVGDKANEWSEKMEEKAQEDNKEQEKES